MAGKRLCDMSYEDVNTIIWSQDIVWDELSIDECMYTLLLLKLQTQLITLDLLEERLNTIKVKTVLWQEFAAIYHEFNNIFSDVSAA